MDEMVIKKFVAQKLHEGFKLSDIQNMLAEELDCKMTFLDLRLMAAELEDVDWSKFDPAEKKAEDAAEAAPAAGATDAAAENAVENTAENAGTAPVRNKTLFARAVSVHKSDILVDIDRLHGDIIVLSCHFFIILS